MQIPFCDVTRDNANIHDEIAAAIDRVARSGAFILGEEVAAFEREFAEFCGVSYCVGVANGTEALTLALRAIGIGPGDEVITVSNSFVASASCVALAGAMPVFADVSDALTIDPASAERAITPRTKAIIAVHLTGRPAAMHELRAIADRHHLRLVEDAAQAAGARYGGCHVGGFGDIAAFSFHPNKTLGGYGDGGAILTKAPDIHAWLLAARNHGIGRSHSGTECLFWSGNSRLDALQAAVLRVKLPHLDAWNARRRELANGYRVALADVVDVPQELPGEYSVYHLFVVRTPERDALQKHLSAQGIETRIHYPSPIHCHSAAAQYRTTTTLPETDRLSGQILSLPLFATMTHEEHARVISAVRGFFSAR